MNKMASRASESPPNVIERMNMYLRKQKYFEALRVMQGQKGFEKDFQVHNILIIIIIYLQVRMYWISSAPNICGHAASKHKHFFWGVGGLINLQ